MTMLIQYLIVGFIIAAAIAYGLATLVRKRKSFSTKPGCEADCGCESKTKRTSRV